MNRFLKSPLAARLTAAARTGTFHPPTLSVPTAFDHHLKLVINNGQWCRRAPATTLVSSAAAKKLEAKWTRYTKKECAKRLKEWNEIEAMSLKIYERSEACQRHSNQSFCDSLNKHSYWLEFFKERQRRYDATQKKLILRNTKFLVGLPVFLPLYRLLILQQEQALEDRTKVMKLKKEFNLWGTLGMKDQLETIYLLTHNCRTYCLPC